MVSMLPEYGNDQLQVLVNFYGKEAIVEFGGKTHTSPHLVNEEEIFAKWRIIKRALAKEKKTMMEKKKMSKPPSLQDVKTEMELSGAHREIFPEIFKVLVILLNFPVATATVECSFSQIKIDDSSSQ